MWKQRKNFIFSVYITNITLQTREIEADITQNEGFILCIKMLYFIYKRCFEGEKIIYE